MNAIFSSASMPRLIDDSLNRHPEITIVHMMPYNQRSDKYKAGDTHLMGMLYSN
jgi:hypothetical protein